MKFKKLGLLGIILSCTVFLMACGDNNKQGSIETGVKLLKDHPAIIKNEGKAVNNSVLKIGYVSDSPFKGVLNSFLSTNSDDSQMLTPMSGAFPVNKDYSLVLDSKKTPLYIHIDNKNKEINIKINPKFKWSNGEPVTTEDIVKTYEIVANPTYITSSQSVRYGGNMMLVKGISEYNSGKLNKISGLVVKSPSEMTIKLTKMDPSVLWGGCLPSDFINANQFKNIPMNKVESSNALRKNPLSYGPYVVKSLIPGEKIIYEANKYYYKGEPKVKRLEVTEVPTSQQVAVMQSGKFDILWSPSNSVFTEMEALKNVKESVTPSLSYGYLGFKMGTWDSKTNKVRYNPKSKMSDSKLRKAMGYAMNTDEVCDKLMNGLSYRLNTPIIPAFGNLSDKNIKGYPLDIDKANDLLDNAGYKMGENGYRNDKNGKPLNIHFAMMKDGFISQPLSENFIQQWKKIGLNVSLVDGRLLDPNDFYNRIENDDPSIDIFIGGWTTGTSPNPTSYYGPNESFNFQRYENPKLTEALNEINSEKCINKEEMKKAYYNFQKVFSELGVCIPTTTGYDYTVINNRVKYIDNTPGTDWDLSQAELTAPTPITMQ